MNQTKCCEKCKYDGACLPPEHPSSCKCHKSEKPQPPVAGEKKCTCGEPHISNRIQHCYDGTPCHVKGAEKKCAHGEAKMGCYTNCPKPTSQEQGKCHCFCEKPQPEQLSELLRKAVHDFRVACSMQVAASMGMPDFEGALDPILRSLLLAQKEQMLEVLKDYRNNMLCIGCSSVSPAGTPHREACLALFYVEEKLKGL